MALGGADTCTRAKTVWQVNLLANPSTTGRTINCTTRLEAWDKLVAASTGRLAARAEPDPTAADPCTIPVKAGYRRLENQLYRVEIHNPGSPGKATFKWSRDNGSVVAKVTGWPSPNGDQIAVSSTGRDSVLGFAPGQWVELDDDTHELAFQPGTLVRLTKVEDGVLTVDKNTATGSLNPADFPANPKVRRWDSAASSPALANVTAGVWLNLESGVQVNFSAGTFATGDYWLIPARTLTADVDWPVQGGNPVAQLPKGIRRHFCRLAIVRLQGKKWSVRTSCLPRFSPLTGVAPSPAVHVTAVNVVGQSGSLHPIDNDDHLGIPQAQNAFIEAVTDEPLAPVCAHPAACFLTVDLPRSQAASGTGAAVPVGFEPLILNGPVTLSPGGAGLRCAITPEAWTLLNASLSQRTTRLLMHLTLKSTKIWSRDDPSAYLDGEAFGVAKASGLGMRLPSGNGQSAGDFEMWFWLVPPG